LTERIAVIDVNARREGRRYSTLDVIGAGPRHVVGFLRHLGFEAQLYSFEYVVRHPRCLEEYDILAISAMITDYVAVNTLVKLWRKLQPSKPIVLGGPLTLSPSLLQALDFDIAIVGECELPLEEIAQRYGSLSEAARDPNVCSIKGITTKLRGGKGEISRWAPRDVIERYTPDIDGVKRYDFWWACRVYVEIVRGCSNFYRPRFAHDGRRCLGCNLCRSGSLEQRMKCPVNIPPGCGYCSVPLVHGPPRSRSVDSVVNEVRSLLNLGVTRVVLSAPDFLDYGRDLLVHPQPLTDPRDPPPNIDAIEELLRKVTTLPQVTEGTAAILIENVKPCLVNEYVAEVLGRYLRGTPVFIGVESGSDALLERIGRPSRVEECIKAIELLKRAGLRPYIYLIHGLPSETDYDLRRSLEFVARVRKLGIEKIVLYRFTPLPRTAFEGFPRPPPAVARSGARELYNAVTKLNRESKRTLLGKRLRVVIASTYPKKRGYLVAYPLRHGPTTLLRGSPRLIGAVCEAVIERIVSDRLVEGRIVSVIKRIARV